MLPRLQVCGGACLQVLQYQTGPALSACTLHSVYLLTDDVFQAQVGLLYSNDATSEFQFRYRYFTNNEYVNFIQEQEHSALSERCGGPLTLTSAIWGLMFGASSSCLSPNVSKKTETLSTNFDRFSLVCLDMLMMNNTFNSFNTNFSS